MRRRALLLGLGAVAACGSRPRLSPPKAPTITSANDLLPPDLDVALRLDLGRVRAALGQNLLGSLSRQVLSHGGDEQEPDELVVSSLLETEQVYLAYRPSPRLAPLDRVLALQGRFPPLIRPPAGFGGATDLGGDVRYWDKKSPTPRSGVARVYAFGERVRAFVSEAELDAVERTLRGLSSSQGPRPPEEGTLSLAARPRLLAPLVSGGRLRELLESAGALSAVVELESEGVKLKAELLLQDADGAQQLVRAGQLVLSRALGGATDGFVLEAQGERVLLAARLSRAQLVPLWSCAWGDPTSVAGCPW